MRRLAEGTLDVVVGTHRILSKDVSFKDLGLVVIDEEQRFGVAQKEKLKELRASVEVLSMSATPIPRSLNLALGGIRDLSVIETPPKDRLAIATHVVAQGDEVVREAIRAELDRGGQVYLVHNRIEGLGVWRERLAELVPECRVVVGHGQMSEGELERTMRAFTTRAADLLLATTIVENGLDIPTANTMIIDRADLYGLSQLYQLRGRVGRSDKPASCWLLVPPGMALTDDARRRLRAIQEFSDLGAGFRIAAKDLEIRGAGNVLGGEQSGHIDAVGFETYVTLLEEAIGELRGEPVAEKREVTLQLGLPLGLPAKWIGEESLRIALYKRLATADGIDALDHLAKEAEDRYGTPPPEFARLLGLARLRLLALDLGVRTIQRRGRRAGRHARQGAPPRPRPLPLGAQGEAAHGDRAGRLPRPGALPRPPARHGGGLRRGGPLPRVARAPGRPHGARAPRRVRRRAVVKRLAPAPPRPPPRRAGLLPEGPGRRAERLGHRPDRRRAGRGGGLRDLRPRGGGSPPRGGLPAGRLEPPRPVPRGAAPPEGRRRGRPEADGGDGGGAAPGGPRAARPPRVDHRCRPEGRVRAAARTLESPAPREARPR